MRETTEVVMNLTVMTITAGWLLVAGGHGYWADAPQSLTTTNGKQLPALVADSVDNHVMLDAIDADGNQLIIRKDARKAGTRVGIHRCRSGGDTFVLSGEITDFIERRDPKKFPAGTCNYMPPYIFMAAANLGTEDPPPIDAFFVPPGEPTIIILEHDHRLRGSASRMH